MKKSILIGGSALVLVLLLAGAAYTGGQLLNGQGLPVLSSAGGGPQISLGGKSFKLDIQPAKDLPQTPADTKGLFDHRQNNSIFVGTGKVMVSIQKDPAGNTSTSGSHDGPTVEVVVNAQTMVYRDVTMKQFKGNPPAGQKIQQVIEPGSLDEIGQDSLVTVWGKKTGERINAEVLVYSLPTIFTNTK
jgi:hypothetical protein